jgi:hypothetical protein
MVVSAKRTHGVHELADTPTGGDTPLPGNVPTHVDIDPFPTPAPALPEAGATLSPLTQQKSSCEACAWAARGTPTIGASTTKTVTIRRRTD